MRSFYDDWWKKIEPGIDKFIPLVIGSDHENPITLTSDFWANGNYVNTQWKVAQAVGDKKGGVWHVSVEKGGKYKLELSRWPFHLNRQLTRIGPDTAIGGIKIRAGKAIPVKSGSLSLNGKAPIIERASYLATKISMIVEIPPGDNTLQAWFSNEDGNAVCGAYYLRVTRIF
jgi:arylsulfatase